MSDSLAQIKPEETPSINNMQFKNFNMFSLETNLREFENFDKKIKMNPKYNISKEDLNV